MSTRKPFNQRPHFIINNKKITAGGLLIIDFQNEKCLLQYSSKKDRFDDFGGKAELTDDTIIHTIIRELYEESNKLIGSENNKINFKNVKFYYIPQAKYILAVLDHKQIDIETDLTKYGQIEEHTKIFRTVNWLEISSFMSSENTVNINPRLLSYFNNNCEDVTYLFDFIQFNKNYFYQTETETQIIIKEVQVEPKVIIKEITNLNQVNLLQNKLNQTSQQLDLMRLKHNEAVLQLQKYESKYLQEKNKSLWSRIFG